MTTTAPMKRRAILAFMLDRPGVLNKIAMLIRRKMYNVETLTVCKTNQPGTSRMTWREVAIVKFEADESMLEALKSQFKFEILDRQNHELFIVQISGTSQSIDAFLEDIGSDRIVEVARSGFTAMEK